MENNNNGLQAQDLQASEIVKSEGSKGSNNQQAPKVDSDKVMAFVQEIIRKSINTYSDQKVATTLVIAGLVSWGIALLPIFAGFNLALLGILVIVSGVLSFLYTFSLANIALKSIQKETVTVNDATKPLSGAIGYLVTYIKIFVNFVVRLFQPPFIVPGFKYAISSGLFLYANLDKGNTNDEALKYSQEITKGNLLNIFGLLICIVVINIVLGILPFAIGSVVAGPFSALCMAHVYLKLKK